MNITDLRNEYASAKNRAFDQGCEGGFRADYTEWLEQKLAINTEIIGSVSSCSCMDYRWEVKECGNRFCTNCGENKTNNC